MAHFNVFRTIYLAIYYGILLQFTEFFYTQYLNISLTLRDDTLGNRLVQPSWVTLLHDGRIPDRIPYLHNLFSLYLSLSLFFPSYCVSMDVFFLVYTLIDNL